MLNREARSLSSKLLKLRETVFMLKGEQSVSSATIAKLEAKLLSIRGGSSVIDFVTVHDLMSENEKLKKDIAGLQELFQLVLSSKDILECDAKALQSRCHKFDEKEAIMLATEASLKAEIESLKEKLDSAVEDRSLMVTDLLPHAVKVLLSSDSFSSLLVDLQKKGADNRPPMLEKDMYDSWKSIMELYMMNRQHGRMILESVENGPLIWPSIEENGVTRPKKYSELSATEAIQADYGRQECPLACGTTRTDTPGAQVGSNSGNKELLYVTTCKRIGPYVQSAMQSFEQSNVAAIHNSNSYAQQDALILSVIEQLKTQVVNYTKINLDNKSVNDTLTAEHERYKEQSVEIDRLKQTISEHLKENKSLMQTVILLKNNFKKDESRNIDREIALEKRIKQLDNIVFKRDQSAQTVHMLTKPQFFYDHTTKQALGFQNPFYLKKAQQLEPKLYDGNVIKNMSAIVIPDSKETLMIAEESLSKMLLKQKDPMMLEKKVNTTPSQNSVNFPEPTLSSRPTKVEVPKELPKVSMVNTSLKKLKYHLADFDVVVKERTIPTAITKGSWG
ncbi:hypothetical protein Tco_1119100, partial [Tanacetum coccineum]